MAGSLSSRNRKEARTKGGKHGAQLADVEGLLGHLGGDHDARFIDRGLGVVALQVTL